MERLKKNKEGFSPDTRIKHLLNTSLDFYRYTNLLCTPSFHVHSRTLSFAKMAQLIRSKFVRVWEEAVADKLGSSLKGESTTSLRVRQSVCRARFDPGTRWEISISVCFHPRLLFYLRHSCDAFLNIEGSGLSSCLASLPFPEPSILFPKSQC
jgi:hypothetical protein